MAYHHNVAVKRKKRLIVLMTLDRPTDLYANDASDRATLHQYLRQYTYIDYTADDWLDKLLYALPLRSLLQRNADCNNNVLLQHNGDRSNDVLLQSIEDPNDNVSLQPNEDRNDDDVPLLENIQLQ